ncbi:hypothetical protein G647_03822 [Cladophialophora carrionii CBS 160.54]|uniref:FAD-binding domain-containing protein n=1 Tax=Cladophialophora carrionii CBS 160.54 TaxID=1279043 RepID=V9DDR0_9EURO|nr:uncharacterized protein G647_03822 [Cladophialophora carrionii CBS 160.54]ETI24453.1 hypothetical protein G647_03822 [Cladophialophora carrionii CBS 160.54]
MKSKTSVLISGAGPVGLLIALRLGQAGIDTLLVEKHASLQPATRAMVYMPVVIPVLTALGIFDKVREEAFLNTEGITWRDATGRPLGRLRLGMSLPESGHDGDGGDQLFGGVLLLGQWKMARLILDEITQYPCVEVCFGVECVGIQERQQQEQQQQQHPTEATEAATTTAIVTLHERGTGAEIAIEATYVVGADGANSSVRRIMSIPFHGFSYPWKMIGADVLYDFVAEEGFSPVNFIVHPVDWAVVAFTGEEEDGHRHGSGKRPLWRVAYVEPPDLPAGRDDYVARARDRIPRCFMNRGSKEFELLRAEPYINSQKCAAQARKGRVVLAGDALHSNNPIGGLGLTGGICDAFAYGNALARVLSRGEPDSLLTECAETRRQTWLTVTDVLSQANIQRLYRFDDQGIVAAREAFFKRSNEDANFARDVRRGLDKMLSNTFE